MKKLLLIIILLLPLCACTNQEKNTKNDKESLVEKVIDENNYVLLDVRTKEEFDESHLVGALNIPYDTIDEKTNLDKTKTILVYCRSGNRSNIASKTLQDLGFTVIDLGAYDKINLPKE